MSICNLINSNRFGRYNNNLWYPGLCPFEFSGPDYNSVHRKAYLVFCRFSNAYGVHVWSADGLFFSRVLFR
jgi:hypothetical protein